MPSTYHHAMVILQIQRERWRCGRREGGDGGEEGEMEARKEKEMEGMHEENSKIWWNNRKQREYGNNGETKL